MPTKNMKIYVVRQGDVNDLWFFQDLHCTVPATDRPHYQSPTHSEWVNSKGQKHNCVDPKSPAVIDRYPSGETRVEYWYTRGQLNSPDENTPAVIYYTPRGVVSRKEYCVNGNLHNEGGPAIVRYSESGLEMGQEYWLNGEQIPHPIWRKRTQAPIDMTKAELEKALGYRINIVD